MIKSDYDKRETPLFSVITVTYNAEKELPATLKSVREQTFDSYEHLIIDGASSDATFVSPATALRSHSFLPPPPTKVCMTR